MRPENLMSDRFLQLLLLLFLPNSCCFCNDQCFSKVLSVKGLVPLGAVLSAAVAAADVAIGATSATNL